MSYSSVYEWDEDPSPEAKKRSAENAKIYERQARELQASIKKVGCDKQECYLYGWCKHKK